MRIFYDHQVFSLQDAGGAPRYHYELAKHLARMFDVDLRIAPGINNSVYPFRELRGPRTRVFEKRSQMRPGVLRYAANEALSSPLALTLGLVDIYHPTLYRAMPFVRRRHVVATNHDCAHERYPELFRHPETVIGNKRRLYATADAIICVSESSRQDVLKFYGVDPARVFVVHHGFSPLTVDPHANASPCEISRPYLLFVGFRGTYKNFQTLLEAYSGSTVCKDFDLLTVGGGKFSEDELTQMAGLGVRGKVKNLLRVSDSTLACLYRGASLFIYPSLHEGFGFPPLEAMSMGCIALVSATSSLPEVCGSAAYYFDPTDSNDLRSRIEFALSSPDAQSMKRLGYEQVRKYDWGMAATNTFNIYRKVLGV